MYKLLFSLLLLFFVYAFPTTASAHESRPLYIEITEIKANTYKVQMKVPPVVNNNNQPKIVFPKSCERKSHSYFKIFKCKQSIVRSEIVINYPKFSPSVSTMIRFKNLEGELYTELLTPEERSWQIPSSETVSGIAAQYTKLGIDHIWSGWDHLLFLVCLLFIAGTGRRILITITGFTVAHSVTLFLSALELVRIPIPPVEAVVALSVVFLASEIARSHRDTLTWKYPIVVSSSFGLLHGFAFAAVLGEIGLPQTELLTGLLFFNVGVEIGQIIFVLSVIALLEVLMVTSLDLKKPILEKSAAYAVGTLAAFWMFERIVGFLI